MIDSIVREVGGWVLLSKEFQVTPLSLLLCNWFSSLSWSIRKARKVSMRTLLKVVLSLILMVLLRVILGLLVLDASLGTI